MLLSIFMSYKFSTSFASFRRSLIFGGKYVAAKDKIVWQSSASSIWKYSHRYSCSPRILGDCMSHQAVQQWKGQDHFDRFALRVLCSTSAVPELNSNQPETCLQVLLLLLLINRPFMLRNTATFYAENHLLLLLLLLLGRNIYWCKAHFMGSSSHLPAVYPQNNLIFQLGLILVEDINRLSKWVLFHLAGPSLSLEWIVLPYSWLSVDRTYLFYP